MITEPDIKMKVLLLIVIYTCVCDSFATYGDLRIAYDTRLEFRLQNGQWGTVCKHGFDNDAAKVACKQLGYDLGNYDVISYVHTYNSLSVAICFINCGGYESHLADCYTQSCSHDYNSCSHYDDITLSCYYQDNSGDSSSSSHGAAVGAAIGSLLIFGIIVFLIICRVFVRYSYIRRNANRNHTIVVTQRRAPRILIARVTRTFASGPPPPPSYTPSDPNSGYAPVPPRGYQPVATTDYTPVNAPSVAPDDVPSEPPPEYTPVEPVPSVAEESTQ